MLFIIQSSPVGISLFFFFKFLILSLSLSLSLYLFLSLALLISIITLRIIVDLIAACYTVIIVALNRPLKPADGA